MVSTTGAHHPIHDSVEATIRQMFPMVGNAAITHRWGGVMGLSRDWTPSVGFDRATGMAWGGGYVGDGVATAKLAGQTIAELVTGTESDRTDLPWVDHLPGSGSPSRSAGSASTPASDWRPVPTGLKLGPVERPAGSTG